MVVFFDFEPPTLASLNRTVQGFFGKEGPSNFINGWISSVDFLVFHRPIVQDPIFRIHTLRTR